MKYPGLVYYVISQEGLLIECDDRMLPFLVV